MNSHTIVSMMSGNQSNPAVAGGSNVVEIGLLLPASRAAALVRLAKDRQESVGQILRNLIERELADLV